MTDGVDVAGRGPYVGEPRQIVTLSTKGEADLLHEVPQGRPGQSGLISRWLLGRSPKSDTIPFVAQVRTNTL